jgi:hypothetical protein
LTLLRFVHLPSSLLEKALLLREHLLLAHRFLLVELSLSLSYTAACFLLLLLSLLLLSLLLLLLSLLLLLLSLLLLSLLQAPLCGFCRLLFLVLANRAPAFPLQHIDRGGKVRLVSAG